MKRQSTVILCAISLWAKCQTGGVEQGLPRGNEVIDQDLSGQLVMTGKLENGIRIGEWKFYDERGRLIRDEHWEKAPVAFVNKLNSGLWWGGAEVIIDEDYKEIVNRKYPNFPYHIKNGYYCTVEREYNDSGKVFRENKVFLTDTGFIALTFKMNPYGKPMLIRQDKNYGMLTDDFVYYSGGQLGYWGQSSGGGRTFEKQFDRDGHMIYLNGQYFYPDGKVRTKVGNQILTLYYPKGQKQLETYENYETVSWYPNGQLHREVKREGNVLVTRVWDEKGKPVFLNDTGSFYFVEYYDHMEGVPSALCYKRVDATQMYVVEAFFKCNRRASMDTILSEIRIRVWDRATCSSIQDKLFKDFSSEPEDPALVKAFDILSPYMRNYKIVDLPE